MKKSYPIQTIIEGERVSGFLQEMKWGVMVGITEPFTLLTGRRQYRIEDCVQGAELSPLGVECAKEVLFELYEAGVFLEERLPRWVKLYRETRTAHAELCKTLHKVEGSNEGLDHLSLRDQSYNVSSYLRSPIKLLPNYERLERYHLEGQALVLLHRWLCHGPIQICNRRTVMPRRLIKSIRKPNYPQN